MECSCCGVERDVVVGLQCHGEVKVCRDCLGWLCAKAGVVDSTPILPVADMAATIDFYETAGFDVVRHEGAGYAFVSYEGESVFDLDEAGPALVTSANKAGCYLVTAATDEWHRRLDDAGVPVSVLDDKPWGMREFTLTDPSGNTIRIGRSADGQASSSA